MQDFKFLLFLDKLKPIFHKLGIDYAVMRKILQIKLLMDGRRVPTVFTNNKKNNADTSNKFMKSLAIYVLMGLILIPFVWMKSNYISQMSIVFLIIMFFLMTSLISDFSSVLLDIKDKNIIGTKPVDSKTLRLAKTIHISYYMFCITAALVGPALFASLYRQGVLFFLTFLVAVILLDLFVIVLTSLIYLLVLRFFDGEKLKDIINYIQIILTIVISIGYQLFARLFNIMDLNLQFELKWWHFFATPIWFAAPFQMIKKHEINSTFLLLSVMAIVIPLVAIAFYIHLMPLFERSLQKLSNNSGPRKNAKKKPVLFLSKFLCSSQEERAFFRFATNMMKREREFKLKVYPSLGFSIVFPFIFIFQSMSDVGIKELSRGKSYFFIYFCGIMLPTLMWMMRYSANYKGAWIYKALPIQDLTPLYKGTMKALLSRLFFPLYLLEGTVFVAIYGVRIVPDLFVVFINMMTFYILCFMINGKSLPFSQAYESTQQTNALLNLMLMLVLALLAGIHFGVTYVSYGIYVYFVVAVILNLVLWNVAFRSPLQKVNKH